MGTIVVILTHDIKKIYSDRCSNFLLGGGGIFRFEIVFNLIFLFILVSYFADESEN
jgi:hypothetical protein